MARNQRRWGKVSATEAAKNFGRFVDRVREEHATYLVERGGRVVARVSPADSSCTVGELKAFFAGRRTSPEFAAVVASAHRRHNKPRVRRNPWAR